MDSLSIRKLSSKDFVTMPWKNGQGSTTELYKYERANSGGSFLWRLSIATIGASGPFSLFPGYDRSITLLQGPTPTLSHENGSRITTLKPLVPYQFSGDWETYCALPEPGNESVLPCRDFNVMVLREALVTEVTILREPELRGWEKPLSSSWTLFFVHSGSVSLAVRGNSHQSQQELSVQDLLIVAGSPAQGHVRFETTASATIFVIQIDEKKPA